MSLIVKGFEGNLHNLNGTYTQAPRENHGRPVFVKAIKGHDKQQSCVYYWDERGGADMAGWWMAPEVGGEHVWTHNTKCLRLPPNTGWKVPWHGEPDPKVTFHYMPPSARSDERERHDREDSVRERGHRSSTPVGKGTRDVGRGDTVEEGQRQHTAGQGSYDHVIRKIDQVIGRSDPATGRREERRERNDRVSGRNEVTKGRNERGSGRGEAAIGRSDRVSGRDEAATGRSSRVLGKGEPEVGRKEQRGSIGQLHIPLRYETHGTVGTGASSTAGKGAPTGAGKGAPSAAGTGALSAAGKGAHERNAATTVGIPQQQVQPTSSSMPLPGGVISLAKGKARKDSAIQRQEQLRQQQLQQLHQQQQLQFQLQQQLKHQQPVQQHQLLTQQLSMQQQRAMQWPQPLQQAQVPMHLPPQQAGQLRLQQEQQRQQAERQRVMQEAQKAAHEEERKMHEERQRKIQEAQEQKMHEEQERKAAEERRRKQLLERERLVEQKRNEEEEERRQREMNREVQKAKEDEVKALVGTEVMKKLTDFEGRMEACKDASAVLTSDVADHLTPEDTIATYNEGKDTIAKSYAIYMDVSTQLKNLDNKINDPLPASTELQQHLASISKRLENTAQPFLALRDVCEKYGRKAKAALAEQERLAALQSQREKMKRAAEWNAAIFARVTEDVIIGDMAVKKAKGNSTQLPHALVALRRTTRILEDAIANDFASNDTKAELRTMLKRTHASLSTVAESAKRMKCEDGSKEELLGIELSVKLQARDQELQFAQFSTEGQMSRTQFLKLAAHVGMTEESARVFDEALRISQKPALSLSDYQLYIQARYMRVATENSVLSESETKTTGAALEIDEPLKLLSAPMTVNGVWKYHVERLKDSTTGYVTGKENDLVRFTPRLVCVQATVLTDSLELKGFKVLKRLKKGDTFEAHGVPVTSKASGLLRIRGQNGDNVGWTTIRGNQGTSYFKVVDAVKEADIDNQESIPPLTDDERGGILRTLKDESLERVEAALQEVAIYCELLDTRCLEVTAISDASPSKEQITEMTTKLVEAQTAAQSSLTGAKMILLELARLVSKCTTDSPLGQLRQALIDFPAKLNSWQAQVLTMARGAHDQILEMLKTEDARLRREVVAKAEQQVAAWNAELAEYEEEVVDEVAKAELVAQECAVDLQPLDTCIANAEEAIQKTNRWIDEILPKEGSNIVHYQLFRRNVGQFRTRMFKINKRMEVVEEARGELEKTLSIKARLRVGIALRNYMKEKNLTAEQIFNGDVEMDFTKFLRVLTVAEVNPANEDSVQDLFDVFGPAITPAEFSFIAQPRYRVLEATPMTDTFKVKGSKSVLRVAEDDVIDCLGMPEVDEESKETRINASFAGTEGFITIKENAGTVFLTPYFPAYVIKVETVMTNILQMKGFKVLRRLKLGEVLNTCVAPARDDSGLLRIKGTMPDGIEGWVTIIGSNGIKYLENCKRLTAAEIAAQEEAKKEEMAAQAAKSAEEVR